MPKAPVDENRHFPLSMRKIRFPSNAPHLLAKTEAGFPERFGALDFPFCSRATYFGHAFATLAFGKEVYARHGIASYNSRIVTSKITWQIKEKLALTCSLDAADCLWDLNRLGFIRYL